MNTHPAPAADSHDGATQHEPTVADAMIRAPKQCGFATTAGALRHLFRNDHVHAALIVRGGTLITVIERADLDDMTGGDVSITDDVLAAGLGRLHDRTVLGSTPLQPVHRQMIETGHRRLAVVDDNGRLTGLLCLKRSGDGFCSDKDVNNRTPAVANATLVLTADLIAGCGPARRAPVDRGPFAADDDLVALLEGWHLFGGTWQVTSRVRDRVTISLCRCDGREEQHQVITADPKVLDWLTGQVMNTRPWNSDR